MKLKKILMFCSIFTMIFSGGSFALDNVSSDAEENIVKIVLVKDGKEQEITQDELDKIIEESNKEYVESKDIDNFNYIESHDARLVNPPRYQYIESSRIKEYHHKGRNKHHWEYWVDFSREGVVPAKMPTKYVVEMFCDRVAATMVYRGENFDVSAPLDYYNKTHGYYVIHQETDAMIKDMLVHLSKSNLEETIDYIKETYL